MWKFVDPCLTYCILSWNPSSHWIILLYPRTSVNNNLSSRMCNNMDFKLGKVLSSCKVNEFLLQFIFWVVDLCFELMYSLLWCCSLIKEETQRPKYNKLLEDRFIRSSDEANVDVAQYVSDVLDLMANNGATAFTMNQPWLCLSNVVNVEVWRIHYLQPDLFPIHAEQVRTSLRVAVYYETFTVLCVFRLFSIVGVSPFTLVV